MRMTALSFVAVCAVAAVASAWEVPAIPAGRRAQFYLLKDDGAYQYGYDTGTGHSASAAADAANEVQGAFRYRAADGRDVAVSYSAGQGGYVPQLSAEEARAGHISPPHAGVGSRIGGSGAAHSNSNVDQDPDYDANADASYSFTIDTDSYQRQEESDARGNVRGSYSYSSPQGGSHSLTYTAGEGTGFVVTGGTPSSSIAAATAGASHVGTIGTVAKTKQFSNVPSVIPYSSEGTSGHSVAAKPYSGPVANIRSDQHADGSYSFAFGTDLLSREESADAQNNVRGSYSFKSDGTTRRVEYEAGAATGFVARGDHLPIAPSVLTTSALPSAPIPVPVSNPVPPTATYSAPAVENPMAANVDGSYSFAFNTADQSRQESSDAQNNVRGSYSFKSKDDGKVRRIDYEAGSATGFVARGEHLPVAPAAPIAVSAISSYSAPSTSFLPPSSSSSSLSTDSQSSSNVDGSYSFAYSTNDQSRQESADAQNNVRGSYSYTSAGDGQRRRVDYEAGANTGFIAKGAHLPAPPALPSVSGHSSYSAPIPSTIPITSSADSRSASNVDGSYAFSYSTDELSREESADAQNNVRGSYSFRAKGDGKTRRVDYEAGAATGFIARGDHLPRASAAVSVAPSLAVPANHPPAAVRRGSAVVGDRTHTFSYDAGDHSRQEAIDSSGNVRGSYSFVAKDDGRSRRVDYSAGAATGFVASGEHLPKAPLPALPRLKDDTPTPTGDASYAYSYETDSSKKSESADAQGNVRGEYSYVAGDGSTRRVTYTARDEEGFVASGDVNPSAVGVAATVQTAKSAAARTNQRLASSHSRSSQSNAALKHRSSGLVVDQYLPPQSPHKFGYIFDTKA